MKTSFQKLILSTLLCASSSSFMASPLAAATLWTATTFASQSVRGFNDPGDISDASMAAMAATGANIARFFVELSLNTGANNTATAYTYNPAPLASIVASAAKYGFKVVIALDDPNSTYTDNQIWANTPQGSSLRASIKAIWQAIAKQYNGNTSVAAYDVFNEPVVANSNTQSAQNQWITIASSWINAIRAIDPNHTIIFEPTPWALAEAFTTTLTNPLPFSNIVYSFHEYDPHSFTAQGISSYTQESYPTPSLGSSNLAGAMQLSLVQSFQHQFNVPIYVGEFSCPRWAPVSSSNGLPSCYNWVHDTIPLFEAAGWSWSFHDWRGYYGWDPDMPESFFYQYPYVNAQPQLNWGLYNSNLVLGDANNNPIGFSAFRSNMTDTMLVLQQSFTSNGALTPSGVPISGLQNGGFETPATSAFVYNPTGGSWAFLGDSGIQHNGSAWGAPNAPNGAQTAFLQDGPNGGTNGTISQSIYLPSSGTYSVSFQAALRSYQTSPSRMSFQVQFDGNVVGTFSPSSTSFSLFTTSAITLTAGTHTLSFVGTGTAPDTSDFIDSVILNYPQN